MSGVLTTIDPERVRAAIAGGETFTTEFKGESRERLPDRDLVEAVVCLANGRGGLLLVGVEDDRKVTGARPRHESGRTDPLRIQALLANCTQPPVQVAVDVIDIDGRPVLCIEFCASRSRTARASSVRHVAPTCAGR